MKIQRKPQPAAEARRVQVRRQIWRAIRDAGAKGLHSADVTALPIAYEASSIKHRLAELLAGGYISKDHHKGPYRVNGDCRTPAGEEPVLGPGWDDENADLVDRIWYREAA